MTKLTINTQTGSYVESGADKDQNLQALAEAFGGITAAEHTSKGTWAGSVTTLTITDTRVKADSKIIIGATVGTVPRIGLDWRVSSIASGTFTITSDEQELVGCQFWYFVIN